MSYRFTDKIIVITGGTTGIGYAAAQAFIAEGAERVYITGRSAANLNAATESLGARAVPVVADVADLESFSKIIDAIKERDDRIDVIFANAGIAETNAFDQTSEAEFDRTFDINAKGVFFTVQKLAPFLRDGGAIVLNASIVASKGMANLSLYNASKAAVRSFARSFATELKGRKIRVNAVSPGYTRTPIFENGLKMDDAAIAAFEVHAQETVPLGTIGKPEEIAGGVLFLASDSASYVNGVELVIDGGLTQV